MAAGGAVVRASRTPEAPLHPDHAAAVGRPRPLSSSRFRVEPSASISIIKKTIAINIVITSIINQIM